MHEIEIRNVSEEFARCWQAAGLHMLSLMKNNHQRMCHEAGIQVRPVADPHLAPVAN
jgi:hypothetical protein